MSTSVVPEAAIRCNFCPSAEEALRQAFLEAADTGGVLLRVRSMRVEHGATIMVGLIPSDALVADSTSEVAGGCIYPRAIGRLHLTWSTLLHPNTSEDIGFLILQTPVAVSGVIPHEEDDSCWAALAVERVCPTLPQGNIGPACCTRCNRPISQQRLKAIPGAKLCTACQQSKEK